MKHSTQVTWQDEMAFDVEIGGHHFTVDADDQVGGKDRGPRPKPLVLAGLGGCTGMDVVSILRKMRMPWDTFSVQVEADVTEEHPKQYSDIKITYVFTGAELDRAKIERAVELSQTRYCGVTAMLGKAARITHEILLNPA